MNLFRQPSENPRVNAMKEHIEVEEKTGENVNVSRNLYHSELELNMSFDYKWITHSKFDFV